MSAAVMIAEAIAAGKLRRIPLGVAGLDPVTQRPWPSFEAALAATERSREIAACPRLPSPAVRRARRDNWATPEKDALIRQMVRDRCSLQQIAARLDVGSTSVIYRRCVKLGIETSRRRSKSVARASYYSQTPEHMPCT